MATFPFVLVCPERIVFEGQVKAVTLRSAVGDITFMAGHSPYIGSVEICGVRIEDSHGHVQMAAVDGGFVRAAGNKVSLVSPSAELATDIDAERVLHMRMEAQQVIDDGDNESGERLMRYIDVQMELAETK